MSRPGKTISRSETRPSRSARTAVGPWFTVGTTGTADTDPLGPRKPVKSLTEYATRFGARSAHVNDGGGGATAMYDAAEFYFKTGGAEMFVSPVTYSATPSVYETNLAAALLLFTVDLGPGQVSAPGRTTAATRLAIATHVAITNRIAILATTNTAVSSTLVSEATIASITPDMEDHTSLWTPWCTVSGVNGVGTRVISPESLVAGKMALNDALGTSPNQPSAGELGQLDEVISLAAAFDDATRTTLNLNGVNVIKVVYEGARIYGYRTLADPSTDDNWVNLANARLAMAIQAEFDAVAERYVFREIDGQRHTLSEFGGELTGQLLPYWGRGSLFGVTPEQAFRVDVGVNVNTDTTIANKEIRANVRFRASEFGEEVILDMVKVRTLQEV